MKSCSSKLRHFTFALLLFIASGGITAQSMIASAYASEIIIENSHDGDLYDGPNVNQPSEDPAYRTGLDMRDAGASEHRLDELDDGSTDATCTVNCDGDN